MKKIWWILICVMMIGCQQEELEIKTITVKEKVENYALEDDANLEEMIEYIDHVKQVQNNFNPSIKIQATIDLDADLEALADVKDSVDDLLEDLNALYDELLDIDTDIVLKDDQLIKARHILKTLRPSFETHRLDVHSVVTSDNSYITLLTEFYTIRQEYFRECLDLLEAFKQVVINETL